MPVIRPPRALAYTISIAGILQIVLALAVAAIVQLHLRTVDITRVGSSVVVSPGTCLLGPPGAIVGSTCHYAYLVCSVSIFAAFAVSLLRCARVGWGLSLEIAFSSACIGWWFVAAGVFTSKAIAADRASLPSRGWRATVVTLAWIETVTFVVLAVGYSSLAKWARAQAAALIAAGGGGGGVEMGVPPAAAAAQGPPPTYGGGAFFGVPAYPPPPQQQQPAVQYAFGPAPTAVAAPAPAPPAAPPPPAPAPPPADAKFAPAPPPPSSGNPFAPN